MSSAISPNVTEDLRKDWMTWLTLHHFLPTRLLRGLASIIVGELSNGRVGLSDLFEETVFSSSDVSDDWILRPRALTDRHDGYLQGFVRSLAWRNDAGGWGSASGESAINARILNAIGLFAMADLTNDTVRFADDLKVTPADLHPSLVTLLDLYEKARASYLGTSPDAFWRNLDATGQRHGMPLDALMRKHLADLCVDADAWSLALRGYELVEDAFARWVPPVEWQDAARAWSGIALQSRATALAVVSGPRGAAALLHASLADCPLESRPLFVANASDEELYLSSHPDMRPNAVPDRRTWVARAPLLHQSHSSDAALHYSLNKDYADANRNFWAVLRRQTALGAGHDARETRTWYARSIVAELATETEESRRPGSLKLAVSLLLEGGREKPVSAIEWTEALVNAYVDEKIVAETISRASAFPGVLRERHVVAISLFSHWFSRLEPAHKSVAISMWRHIARFAAESPAEITGSIDVGRSALKALTEFAKRRPEWRIDLGDDVANAICRKLTSDGLWWGKAEALNTASEYADSLESETLVRIVELTLDVLGTIDPAREVWPLVRPALQFLVCDGVGRVLRVRREVGAKALDAILRFGLEQESERSRIFFYLHDFDQTLLSDPVLRERLRDSLQSARGHARETNSSAAAEGITALLIVPTLCGREGLEDAIAGLIMIIETATGSRQAPSLAYAFDCVLTLSRQLREIRDALPTHDAWLDAKLAGLGKSIAQLWATAIGRPQILCGFSIPPKEIPDPIIVHNWAYASMDLAERVGVPEVLAALEAATRSEVLGSSIRNARATRAGDIDEIVVREARAGDREGFYAALGRRLALAGARDDASAIELWKALVEQCLRFGPRDVDAAILLGAARLNLHTYVRDHGLEEYRQRIKSADLRVDLIPIVALFARDKARAK